MGEGRKAKDGVALVDSSARARNASARMQLLHPLAFADARCLSVHGVYSGL